MSRRTVADMTRSGGWVETGQTRRRREASMATIEIWSQHSEPQVPAGSNDAQDELATLYGALWPRLLNRVRFKWRIRGEVAEDLVHDAWVRAIEHYDRFDRDRPFEPWALRILDNVVIDH